MKDQKEKILMSMRVKVINTFRNPMTGRMLKKGQELNVQKHRFWFKRLKDKDIEYTLLINHIKATN